MPGLVGFFDASARGDNGRQLQRMMQALEPIESGAIAYTRQVYSAPEVALGRVHLDFSQPYGQPVWNPQKTRCLLLEGELFEQERLQKLIETAGGQLYGQGDAALLLALFDLLGEECLAELNGGFSAAIWDLNQHELILINDRLGLYPLYYASFNRRFAFASGVRALLADPDLPRSVDRVAIAEFLTFDHLLHDRTLLESVKLMPQGTILRVTADGLNIKSYFDFQYPDIYPLRKESEYVAEFLELMEQAVRRQAALPENIGVLLSGGLDSRLILPYLAKHHAHRVQAFTWGNPKSDDVRFAGQLARAIGVDFHAFDLPADWVQHKASQAVRLTDGMGNLVNLHALATLDQEVQYTRVIHKGFLGDAMFGFAVKPYFWGTYAEQDLMRVHLQAHTEHGVINFDQGQREALFSEAFKKHIRNAVLDEYQAGMLDSGKKDYADQRLYFDFRQRVPRMTIKGVEVVRSQAIVRLPFADKDLLDFSLRLPPGYRYERRIPYRAFIQAFPNLAQIPVTPSGLPLMSCAREIRIRTGRLLRWHLIQRGLMKGPYTERRPYANYHSWFRTNLRPWVEENLLSEKALSRGYYQPEAVRQLVRRHMQGENLAVQLGAMLSIELWHQLFLD
jgi:asparagine synthase (glutamine-hydrolysing)